MEDNKIMNEEIVEVEEIETEMGNEEEIFMENGSNLVKGLAIAAGGVAAGVAVVKLVPKAWAKVKELKVFKKTDKEPVEAEVIDEEESE